ncbi:MAG: flavin reductase family protein [Zoogloeaceae bacterium]|jgi:flavin reductase (DIM6/NTAB) family NADH-FMN oxidoreductase RutF|nr:flavin reductase family protein [Zoogloeaceae bacterium]
MPTRTAKPKLLEFPLDRAFTFLESGPVLLVSTCHKRQRNLMTLSCHASMGFEPTLGLVLGPWNHSYTALIETGECVVAVPPASLMGKVIDIGNCSGAKVDKFGKFGLTAQKAAQVKAPLVADCLKNLECRVVEYLEARNFFILEGLQAWHNPDAPDQRTFHAVGDGTFIIDGETVNLRRRMTKWQDCI